MAGLAIIIRVLSQVANQYKMKYGKVPVCINGVDLLAKRNSVLCEALITLTKVLANAETLKLVLVSSKSTIMPF